MQVLTKYAVTGFFVVSSSPPDLAGEYRLGERYSVAKLNFAGYINMVVDVPQNGYL